MKKLILSMVVFMIVNTTLIWAQTKENATKISFCGATKEGDFVKYADLINCNELSINNKEEKIKSFIISAAITSDDGSGDKLYLDVRISGNKLDKNGIDFIKKVEAKKSKKLLIEEVIVYEADGKTEKKVPGLIINLKE